MRTTLPLVSILLLVAALLVLPASLASAQASSATDFVRQTSDDVIRIVNASPNRITRVNGLRDAVRGFIDFPTLAQRTLGPHWETRTPAQRTEFVNLLQELIETSYSRKLGNDRIDPGSYSVTFLGERERRGRVTVEANVRIRDRVHAVEVRMQNSGGTWMVFDVVTDDVSLQESYAESFDEIIRQHGWDELLTRMRNRIRDMRD